MIALRDRETRIYTGLFLGFRVITDRPKFPERAVTSFTYC
jgi:hypothetical protein